MARLNLALVQVASTLDAAQNRERLSLVDDVCAAVPAPDLVVLPEAYACDFGRPDTDLSDLAEPLDGPFVDRLCALASQHGTTVVAGMFEVSEDPRLPYNTLVVVGPDGLVASYRKIHLYDSFGYQESDRLLPGAVEPVVLEVGGVRVGLMTCYDLRFPELARALTLAGAELILLPAAWVAGPRKVDHWRTLVTARALENTVYVAAVGQPAPRYTGHSMLVEPTGDVAAELDAGLDGVAVLTGSVDTDLVAATRQENPSLANRRL